MSSELARRIAVTLGALLLYRIGTYITVPGINPAVWAQFMHAQGGSILGVFNAGTGGAIGRLSILALGIVPYITAAYIMQVLSFLVASLRALKNTGEMGRQKFELRTRLLTLVMAAFQGCGIALALEDVPGLVIEPGAQFLLVASVTLVGGTLLLVWLCEQITLRGIGNGIALILSAAIVLNLTGGIIDTLEASRRGLVSNDLVTGLAFLSVVLVIVATLMEGARRREPVEFSVHANNGTAHGGAGRLSLKLNGAGIIPGVIASWLMTLPLLLAGYFGRWDPAWWSDVVRMFGRERPLYVICYALVAFFCVYLYAALLLDPDDAAGKLKRYGGTIPRVEPGEATAAYLDRVLSRTMLFGAVYFVAICLVPEVVSARVQAPFLLAGTSVLVLVCTVLDLQLQVRNLTKKSLGGLRQ